MTGSTSILVKLTFGMYGFKGEGKTGVSREKPPWARERTNFLPTVPDFADVLDNRQKSVLDPPDIEFGGKWKVHQKLKSVHKCVIGRLGPNNLQSW